MRLFGFLRSQRSQGLTEFALVAPVLVLIMFGIVDFGRGIYYYVTLNQAANEGARVAIRGLPPDFPVPSDVDIENTVKRHAAALSLANPCPNGPIVAPVIPPANQGYIYITEAPAPTAYEASPPANAPGQGAAGSGQTAPTFGAGCNSVVRASNNAALQISVYYNFVPLTPLLQQAASNRIILSAYAVYRTEY